MCCSDRVKQLKKTAVSWWAGGPLAGLLNGV